MKVITLDNGEFRSACRRLAGLILSGGETEYAAAVPIITGGARVADILLESFPETPRFDVLMQRPSTAKKDSSPWLFRLLRKLPLSVSDLLRMAESEYLSRFSARKVKNLPDISPELRAHLISLPAGSAVLIIDDSVDTGATVAAVSEAIKRIHPEVRMVVAALTVTMRNPMVTPDFTLYPRRTLIRFPWSKDYPDRHGEDCGK